MARKSDKQWVRLRVSVAGANFVHSPGDQVEMDADEAGRYVATEQADYCKAPDPSEIEPVPAPEPVPPPDEDENEDPGNPEDQVPPPDNPEDQVPSPDEDENEAPEVNLDELKRPELFVIAKELEIAGYSKLKNADLVAAIRAKRG